MDQHFFVPTWVCTLLVVTFAMFSLGCPPDRVHTTMVNDTRELLPSAPKCQNVPRPSAPEVGLSFDDFVEQAGLGCVRHIGTVGGIPKESVDPNHSVPRNRWM